MKRQEQRINAMNLCWLSSKRNNGKKQRRIRTGRKAYSNHHHYHNRIGIMLELNLPTNIWTILVAISGSGIPITVSTNRYVKSNSRVFQMHQACILVLWVLTVRVVGDYLLQRQHRHHRRITHNNHVVGRLIMHLIEESRHIRHPPYYQLREVVSEQRKRLWQLRRYLRIVHTRLALKVQEATEATTTNHIDMAAATATFTNNRKRPNYFWISLEVQPKWNYGHWWKNMVDL